METLGDPSTKFFERTEAPRRSGCGVWRRGWHRSCLQGSCVRLGALGPGSEHVELDRVSISGGPAEVEEIPAPAPVAGCPTIESRSMGGAATPEGSGALVGGAVRMGPPSIPTRIHRTISEL